LKAEITSLLSAIGHFLFIHPHFYARRFVAAITAMSLTLADVKRIANLAQLDMSEEHAETALAELNGIFALAEQMQAIDTTGVEPLSQPLATVLGALPLRLREDVVTESDHRDAYQQPAPASQDGLYLVPKVIE
jgi:aspartyl-tRNA(Asn)/glutamyl-tRNA(Gln) amidotransferase subunit C